MMTQKNNDTGAFITGKLSPKEFDALCGHRPTTRNSYARISNNDVTKAARRLGRATKDAFVAWMNERPNKK
jgi:hypothetical protein